MLKTSLSASNYHQKVACKGKFSTEWQQVWMLEDNEGLKGKLQLGAISASVSTEHFPLICDDTGCQGVFLIQAALVAS